MRAPLYPLALIAAVALAAFSVSTPDREAAAAPAALMAWPDLLTRERPQESATIPYGEDPLQVVDLWLPAGPGPHPTVLMVHGGCWQTEVADRTIMNWIADDLRQRGIAVWNIDYRGVDRPGGAPNGIFQDASAATEALRTHAAEYRLDLDPLVAIGHSAGGHLALWLAARPRIRGPFIGPFENSLPIHHVISLGGLPDLEQAYREKQGCGAEPVAKLMGGEHMPYLHGAEHALYYEKTLPRLAPIGVPQTLINGDRDRIIPTHFAHDYAEKMREAGDKVKVRIIPGQGHVELIAPETAAWAAAVEEIGKALGR